MTTQLALFYVYAAVAVIGAIGLVVARNLIHAVLSLFVSLLSVSAVYLLLGSQFLAAMQLFIYGGAITVLVLFVVMLTRAAPEAPGDFRKFVRPVSLGVCIVFFVVLSGILGSAEWTLAPSHAHDTASLASILFSRYVVPFELAGLALTVALVGAIVLARDDDLAVAEVAEVAVLEPTEEPETAAVAAAAGAAVAAPEPLGGGAGGGAC